MDDFLAKPCFDCQKVPQFNIAMENGWAWPIYRWSTYETYYVEMVIFRCYVDLSEDTPVWLNYIKQISPVMAHKATWDANPSCAAQLAVQPTHIGDALPDSVQW